MLNGMRSLGIGLAFLAVLAAASFVIAGSPAHLGSRFADAYTAFSPLVALYASYRDYLFDGTAVEIPANLAASCERFSYELALFHLDYVVQTESASAGGLVYLARLRAESTSFCDTYDAWIRSLAESVEVDTDLLNAASDDGLFAGIKRTNELLEVVLDEILVGLGEGVERWAFAVSFSMRSLLNQTEFERIDETYLREILYADPEGVAPPFAVPDGIALAMERLVDLSGRDLSDDEADDAVRLAAAIYAYFVGGP
jgi:hypothetical protein